jgi:hypothetical protein
MPSSTYTWSSATAQPLRAAVRARVFYLSRDGLLIVCDADLLRAFSAVHRGDHLQLLA